MTSYSGFLLQDDSTEIRTWVWGSNSQPKPRLIKGVSTYNPTSANRSSTTQPALVFIPETVYPGPFYMKLEDILIRTGKNSASESDAKAALTSASSLWKTDLSGWSEDGSPTVVPYGKIDPTPGTPATYKTDEELSAMWSLVVQRIRDAPTQSFNVNARFWEPPVSNAPYQIYIVPTSAMTVDQVTSAVSEVLKLLDPTSIRSSVTVIPNAPAGARKVGHNFLCLYDTYMKDDEYKRMVTSTYGKASPVSESNPWPIRSWPTLEVATAANNKLDGVHEPKSRKPRTSTNIQAESFTAKTKYAQVQTPEQTMNGVDANIFGQLFWPNATTDAQLRPPYNAEWLSRAGQILGVPPRRSELFFGTSECGTQLARAESSIKQFVLASGWSCKLMTTPSDAAQSAGTRWMSQFDTADSHGDAPAFVGDTSLGKAFTWAIPFLDYEFIATDDQTKQTLHVLDRFDTFNRYLPLRLEAELDKVVLATFVKSVAPQNANSVPIPNQSSVTLNHVKDPQVAAIVNQALTQTSQIKDSVLQLERTCKTLFGSNISVDIYKYGGTLPNGVLPPLDNASPLYEQVKLSSLRISDFLPDLAGTPLGFLAMSNALFVYQNCLIDSTKGLGWSLECEAVISSNFGPLHEVAHTLLGTADLSVHLSANLGHNPSQNWDTRLVTPSFTLTGTLNLPITNLTSAIQLTSFGIHLHALQAHVDASSPAKLQYAWDIFGSMAVTFPGNTLPVLFDSTLSEDNGTVSLAGSLQGNAWENAVGVKGLKLQNITVCMDFVSGKKPAAADLEVTAQLALDGCTIHLDGVLSGPDFSLTAECSSFAISNLDALYNHLNQAHLTLPDVDIAIGSATFSISAGNLSLSLLNVTVDGRFGSIPEGRFDIPRLEVELDPSKVLLQGALSNVQLPVGSVTLSSLSAVVALARSGQGESHLWFEAQTTWAILSTSLTFDVQAYLYKDSDGKDQYVVFGEVQGNKSSTLGGIMGDSCPEFLKDIGLESITILYSSQDQDGTEIGPVSVPYPIRSGLQITADIGTTIEQVSDVLADCNASTGSDLLFYFRYPDTSFTLQLPTSVCLDFGNGLKTKPIQAIIKPSPALVFEAGLTYQPGGSGAPLDFDFIMELQETKASAALDCKANWNNPLGISPKITIKEVVLGISIVYATASPNNVTLGGQLQIDDTIASVLLSLGDDVTAYILDVTVNEIDVNKLINFTATLLEADLPNIPAGALISKSFHLYACPVTTDIAGITYPAGMSAVLDLSVFGVTARSNIQITTSSGFSCQAAIDNFEFIGETIQDAHLDAAWTRNNRHFSANGRFWFVDWWVDVDIHVGTLGTTLAVDLTTPKETSADAKQGQSNADIHAVLNFPVFGTYKVPVVVRRSLPPIDWQNPWAGETGTYFLFNADLNHSLLATIVERVKRHLEVLLQGIYHAAQAAFSEAFTSLSGGLLGQSNSDVVVEAVVVAERARTTRLTQIEAEFVVYSDKRAVLVKKHEAASENHRTLIRSLTREHATLVQQLAQLPAQAERQRKALQKVLERATRDFATQENMLRARVGNLAEEFDHIISSVALVKDEIRVVDDALQRLSSSKLPWNAAMCRQLVATRAGLLQHLSVFESSRSSILQKQKDVAQSNAEPIFQSFRLAQTRLAEAQKKLVDIATRHSTDLKVLTAAVKQAAGKLQVAETCGPTLQALASARKAIAEHIASKSLYFTDHGQLVNLHELPETIVCTDTLSDALLALDAAAGHASIENTRAFWNSARPEDRKRAAHVADNFLAASPGFSLNLSSISLAGKLDSTKRLEDLVLVADVTGQIGEQGFFHHADFHMAKPDDFVRNLANRILQGIL